MKKILALVMAAAMALSMAACGSSSATTAPAGSAAASAAGSTASASEDGTYELAMVTDVGNIDDKSFNQGTWEGVKAFAEKNGVTYNYYRPSEDSTEAREETIKTAIEKGAKTVVTPGYLFEDAIFDMEQAYPDVNFLLLDGEPHNADYSEFLTTENTHCILYQEEQAGYCAGYAIVKDGYTDLGFLGGMAVDAVIRYGYGFVQGAEAAAQEMGVDVNMKYWYSGTFNANDDIKIKMDGWYSDGTQVVFACGGSILNSCIAAAEATENGKIIGVDVDQYAESDRIVTSAMKKLTTSTELALGDLYGNNLQWPADLAASTSKLGADSECVGLPTADESWRFTTFTVDEYQAMFDKLVSGDIVVDNSTATQPTTTRVTVDWQE